MSFLRATVLVGFVGSLEGTTFLVGRDSYQAFISRWHPGKRVPYRGQEKSTVNRPFTLRTPRKGGASIGTLTLVDLAGTEKDVTYCTGGVVGLEFVCFWKVFCKKGGLFWEKG